MQKASLFLSLILLMLCFPAVSLALQGDKTADFNALQETPSKPECQNKSGEKLENKDAEVLAFAEALESFTNELVRIVKDAPTKARGIKEARSFMEAQRFQLQTQSDLIATYCYCQISGEAKKKLIETFFQSDTKLGQFYDLSDSNPAFAPKLSKLKQDVMALFSSKDTESKECAQSKREESEKAKAKRPCLGPSGEKLEKKDAEINSFVDTINAFTDDLVRQVEIAGTPSIGVDAAQRYMDERKPELKALFDKIKNIGECEVSEVTTERFQKDLTEDGTKMGTLQAKYGSDLSVSTKLRKLTQDFLDIFKM